MFGLRKKPSKKFKSFRPSFEMMEHRLCLSTLVWYPSANPDPGHSNNWGTAHNWRIGSPEGPESLSDPGVSDTVVLSGAVDNTSCGNANGGIVGAISMQASYSGTLTLGADLKAGNAQLSSLLAAGTINTAGYKLTLNGNHDEWDACDVTGGGTVEIAAGDFCARNSGVNSLAYTNVVVDSEGSLSFNSTGGFDFGTTGTMTISGTVTVQPSPAAYISFSGGTTWNVQGGKLDFNDNSNTVVVPVGITGIGSANIIVEACTKVTVAGDVVLGSSGGSDAAALNLWAGSGTVGSKTLLSATGTLKAYGDSIVEQTHNSPSGNGQWAYTTIDCPVEMHDYSILEADGDLSGHNGNSQGTVPVMSLTGSLAFWNQAIIEITSYCNGSVYAGCSYIKCATLTFNYVNVTPRYGFDGSTVPNEKMKFLFVASGVYDGTPWGAPVGWSTTTTQYGAGGMDFFCQNY